MRSLLALLLLPLLAAQDVVADDLPTVERLLASGDQASIAWGAYHAGRLKLAETAPTLVALLRAPTTGSATLRACFTALIDLGQPVVEAGVPQLVWQTGATDAAMLLAATDAEFHRAWLLWRLADESHPVLWMATANLLLRTRHPEALAALHDGLRPSLQLELVVPDNGRSGGSGDRSQRRSVTVRPEGFPPVVHWWIAPADATDGATGVLLADGPMPIFAYRYLQEAREDTARKPPSFQRRSTNIPAAIGSFGNYRVRLLAGLRLPGAPEPPGHDQSAKIACPSRQVVEAAFAVLLNEMQTEGAVAAPADTAVAAVLGELRALRAKHRAAWDAFTHALQEAHVLPVTAKPPRIQVTISEGISAAAERLSLLQTW